MVENLNHTPTVRWTGPGVGQSGVEESVSVVSGHSGAETIITLSFNQLQTSHGGLYACRAVLDVPDAALQNLTNSDQAKITVQS